MDMGTVKRHLDNKMYKTIGEFKELKLLTTYLNIRYFNKKTITS